MRQIMKLLVVLGACYGIFLMLYNDRLFIVGAIFAILYSAVIIILELELLDI